MCFMADMGSSMQNHIIQRLIMTYFISLIAMIPSDYVPVMDIRIRFNLVFFVCSLALPPHVYIHHVLRHPSHQCKFYPREWQAYSSIVEDCLSSICTCTNTFNYIMHYRFERCKYILNWNDQNSIKICWQTHHSWSQYICLLKLCFVSQLRIQNFR